MSETRARRRIRKAVESRGYGILNLEWESWYETGEGPGGGWSMILDRDYLPNTRPGNDMYALSVEELLAEIDYWLKPDGDCGCDRTHSAGGAARLINDPKKPTHGADCEWHIRYRLPWWTPAGSET